MKGIEQQFSVVLIVMLYKVVLHVTFESVVQTLNRPFVLTGHMVQNPPYRMAKECIRFEHKGIPTCQARLSFVFDVPVEDATFFCHPV